MIVPSIKSYGYLSLPECQPQRVSLEFSHKHQPGIFTESAGIHVGVYPPPTTIGMSQTSSVAVNKSQVASDTPGEVEQVKAPMRPTSRRPMGPQVIFEEIQRCNTKKICRLYRSKIEFLCFKKIFSAVCLLRFPSNHKLYFFKAVSILPWGEGSVNFEGTKVWRSNDWFCFSQWTN